MRINMANCTAIMCLMMLTSSISFSSEVRHKIRSNIDIAPHHKSRVIVKRNRLHQSSVWPGSILSKLRVINRFKSIGDFEVLQLPPGMSVKEGLKKLSADPSVETATPDYFLYATDMPNDTDFPKQWALHNSGQTGGLADIDINAPEGWLKSAGNKSTVVGIIDTGVNYKNRDLTSNMWINPGEIAGNGIDDDSNGYIDDIHGINAITNSGDPMDDNGHGTHVAGIIGASGNNGIGVSGIMQTTAIIGCKFLDARGSGSSSDALKCLDYFSTLASREKDKVSVIATNNSWAGGGYSAPMEAAIKKHLDAGILFVAAASNEGQNNDVVNTYPTNYDLPNIISVAAIDHAGRLAGFSNFGKYSTEVAAPGVDILSTFLGEDGYKSLSGTSMAAPYVTGLAGEIRAHNPHLTWQQTRNLIVSSGVPLTALAGTTISGRAVRAADVNGLGALTCSGQTVNKRLSPRNATLSLPLGATIPISLLNISCADSLGVPLATADGVALEINDRGQNGDLAAGDGFFTGIFKPTRTGKVNFEFFDGDILTANVYDSSSWKSYRVSSDAGYQYREITGTNLVAGDDTMHEVISPFPLKFASPDDGFSSINVSSNGVLSVTDNKNFSWDNHILPFDGATSIIAPYWDDLTAQAEGAKIHYAVLGEAPHRELVIEWLKVKQYSAPQDSLTFQVVFFENSTNILFNYLDVDLGEPNFNGGSSATIGVQITQSRALLVGYNQDVIKNKSSLLFVQNTVPLANAGRAQTVLAGDDITLNGSLSVDLDDEQLRYRWRLLGSNPMTFAEQSSPILRIPSAGLIGDYAFELMVTDPSGDASTDTTQVTVIDLGVPGGSLIPIPTVENETPAAPIMISPLENEHVAGQISFDFTGGGDRENDKLTFEIEVHQAASFSSLVVAYRTLADSPNGIVSVQLDRRLAPGTYHWQLRAFDGVSYSPWSRAQFTLIETNAPPAAPTFLFSSTEPRHYLTVKNSVDPDGDDVKYSFLVSESASFDSVVAQINGISEGSNGATSLALSDLGLKNGKTYYFRSIAVDQHGNRSQPSPTTLLALKTESTPRDGGCMGNRSGVAGNSVALIFLTFFLAPRRPRKK